MPTKTIKHLRWRIVLTLFASTVINYISRQTLSVLGPVLTRDLHLSHSQYSEIVSAFQIAYAVAWLGGGILIDKLGVKIGLALAVIWWSVCSMLTGLANSVFSFGLFRFFLGLGEGCNWPGATKTVAEWFPAKERGLAVAIFDSGSSIGAVITPPLVAWIATMWGWRYAFLISGSLGFVWLALWLKTYYPLGHHPRVSREERELIEAERDATPVMAKWSVEGFISLLRQRSVWGLVLGRSLTDPLWWFYVFWIPQYLSDIYGFSLKQIGMFAWIPFVAADLGNFAGGFSSGFLIKRGMPVIRARKWICVLSTVFLFAGIPVTVMRSPYWAIALISVATSGYASWSTMGLTLPSDLFPQHLVASVTGLSGFVSGFAGSLFTLGTGVVIDRFSYLPVFVVASLIPLAATASVVGLIRPESRQVVQK